MKLKAEIRKILIKHQEHGMRYAIDDIGSLFEKWALEKEAYQYEIPQFKGTLEQLDNLTIKEKCK